MKAQEAQVHTARQSSQGTDEAADLGTEDRTLDQDAIARLAHSYWEERGCPNDSPDEDWHRAEAELRNQLAGVVSHG